MAPVEDVRYGLNLGGLDPAELTSALGEVVLDAARHPDRVGRAVGELWLRQTAATLDVARTFFGGDGQPVERPDPEDRRFTDRAWRENPFLRGLMESYLAFARTSEGAIAAAGVPEATRKKAQFALGLLLDALAPTNVPWLNPTVLKEAIDTGGLSVARGFSNFVHDVLTNGGQPSQVDTSEFELGRNLAVTPGRVVYRNDVMELIAYEPQTATVFAQPIVYSPPWINKYYVFDLAPGRSFIEHAVRRGFTVFAMSYRNPDRSLAELTFDDYTRQGVFTAIDQALELTGAERASVVGVCVGGTIAAAGLAALAARGELDKVGWLSLHNTLVDFGDPGAISVFTDEETIDRIEQRITRRGYMEPAEISGPFTLMKGNDLIWRYVVSNWYLGKKPPAFDVLAWNADAMRLPGKMHAQYLRMCYLRNALAEPNAAVVDGQQVDVSRLDLPVYVLSSENDHIVPWRSSYRTTQLVSGDARHVLTAGGHIVGLVSPPGSAKGAYWVGREHPPNPERWLAAAERVEGSWWEDWADWAAARSGEQVPPPVLPDGEPAPGTYVRG